MHLDHCWRYKKLPTVGRVLEVHDRVGSMKVGGDFPTQLLHKVVEALPDLSCVIDFNIIKPFPILIPRHEFFEGESVTGEYLLAEPP